MDSWHSNAKIVEAVDVRGYVTLPDICYWMQKNEGCGGSNPCLQCPVNNALTQQEEVTKEFLQEWTEDGKRQH